METGGSRGDSHSAAITVFDGRRANSQTAPDQLLGPEGVAQRFNNAGASSR